MNKRSLSKTNKRFKSKKLVNIFEDAGKMDVGNIAGVVGGFAKGIQGGFEAAEIDTSEADNALQAVQSYKPNTSSLDALANSYNNTQFAKTNWEGKDFTQSTGQQLAGLFSSGIEGFASGASSGNVWVGVANAATNMISRGIGWGVGNSNAERHANLTNILGEQANIAAHNKATSARDTIQENTVNEFMRNLKSYGGPLYNLGGEFDNGLVFIDEGGTHDENPFNGVLMGVDSQGIPNLVEEGEIIYNDYVFSNRLKPTKKLLAEGGFSDKYIDWTFAKIVEDLQKESAERPNDIISLSGLDDMMNRMITMQETIRAMKGKTGENRLMANGGHIFDGNQDFNTKRGKRLFNRALKAEESGNADRANKLLDRAINAEENPFNWNYLGMLAPTISNIGKSIYNAAKPIDESNLVAEEAYRETPIINLPRLSGKQVYRGIDKNRLTTPIINQGRATAGDIQDLAVTANDALNRLALNNYNTQRAVGEAYANAEQQDLANRMQVAQFNLGIDQANANLSQAEQLANLERANRIAAGKIQDAAMREQLAQMKGQAIDTTSTAAIQGLADLTRQNIEWNWLKNSPQYAEAVAATYGKKANGGMLTRKKRRK